MMISDFRKDNSAGF